MPTKERNRRERGRRQGLTPKIEAFLAIVNDGQHTFPHGYQPKSRGRYERTVVLMLSLVFDATTNDLHAEVRSAAARTALWTVRDAVEELVDRGEGGYQCLRRCSLSSCNRLFFQMSAHAEYHSKARQRKANRP